MLRYVLQQQGIKLDSPPYGVEFWMKSGLFWDVVLDPFDTQLHHFYLACCRKIWKLLPAPGSQEGVEMAEQWLRGHVTNLELNACNWDVEGAAFSIDYQTSTEELEQWIANVELIPKLELRSVLNPPDLIDACSTYALLKRAAYFASFATMYPAMSPKGIPPEEYHLFLSPELPRKRVQYVV
ncbi:MAG: hypothetical protein F6J87_31350 [Spirulina sp. SIO3F2]|nr:hypothetical protein [Spirulina sp. SIO3F2]